MCCMYFDGTLTTETENCLLLCLEMTALLVLDQLQLVFVDTDLSEMKDENQIMHVVELLYSWRAHWSLGNAH